MRRLSSYRINHIKMIFIHNQIYIYIYVVGTICNIRKIRISGSALTGTGTNIGWSCQEMKKKMFKKHGRKYIVYEIFRFEISGFVCNGLLISLTTISWELSLSKVWILLYKVRPIVNVNLRGVFNVNFICKS